MLLLGGFRVLADRASAELAVRGYEDVRPVHDFALRAIMSGADSASELGRRMAVTKQAAAKTIATLEERNYVLREVDPLDKRCMRIRITDHGLALLRTGEELFDEMRAQWEAESGADTIAAVENALRRLVGVNAIRIDMPGWDARDL
ncbi:DNA-binding transcriptional regulator, MarR family [Nakamurella panacisegetis]|uniref:DNA-binding transcriptional regulator, MarR family n=1 Tax=Nakamurella panacisegetis TaxID=1090615 RepID=A0A1H0QLW1_9ACTN|nr:DNA-binding transcriptional regulator, MarR family [Nakamurella panacisegetis]